MKTVTRGGIAWWFDISSIDDPYINVTSPSQWSYDPDSDRMATGLRLARMQQVLENTEGTEWER